MAGKIWIRRDRGTGEEEEISENFVFTRIKGRYDEARQAMQAASKESPLTTGFADYWPKEENK